MQGIEQDQALLLLFMLLYYHNALPRSGNSDLPPSLYVYLTSPPRLVIISRGEVLTLLTRTPRQAAHK